MTELDLNPGAGTCYTQLWHMDVLRDKTVEFSSTLSMNTNLDPYSLMAGEQGDRGVARRVGNAEKLDPWPESRHTR